MESLQARGEAVSKELSRFKDIHFEQQPMPDYIDTMFEYSLAQLKAESKWIAKTLAYMQTKPWDTR